MVGVWEGLNLGSIPNDHMPSQKDPKISIERRCSTILPSFYSRWMQSTLFSFQITLVTQKASVARLRPEILTIKPFLISKKNQTKTIK